MTHLPADEIRTLFSQAMSAMYRQEVPQYGTLIELVRDVNEEVMAADPALKTRLEAADELSRLDVERHGAISAGHGGGAVQHPPHVRHHGHGARGLL